MYIIILTNRYTLIHVNDIVTVINRVQRSRRCYYGVRLDDSVMFIEKVLSRN